MTQEDLIIIHLRELLKVEASAVKDLLGIYREEANRILDELAVMPDDTFRFQRLNLILAQLEAGITQMHARITGKVAAEVRKSQEIGLRQAGRELANGERLYALPDALPVQPAALEARFAPLINLDSLRTLRDASKLSTRRWAAGEIADAHRVLTKGILEIRTSKQVVADLSKVMGPKAKGWELERIARTEIWKAANDAHRLGNEAIADRYPELKMQQKWVAILDRRTCPTCRSLDGVVQDVGQGFGGYSSPPAHPNCRCRLANWSDRWQQRGEVTDQSLDEKRRRIQERLANRL